MAIDLTALEVPNAKNYTQTFIFVRDMIKPIADSVTEQAQNRGYAIYFLSRTQRNTAPKVWEEMEVLANQKGWRVTCVPKDGVEHFFLFTPLAKNTFRIDTSEELSETELEALHQALVPQGFTESKFDSTLAYMYFDKAPEHWEMKMLPALRHNPNYRRHHEEDSNSDKPSILGWTCGHLENPFPDAAIFQAEQRPLRIWLGKLSKHVKTEAAKNGYAILQLNGDALSHPEPLRQALDAYEAAGWKVTTISAEGTQPFLFFLPNDVKGLALSLKEATSPAAKLNENQLGALTVQLGIWDFYVQNLTDDELLFVQHSK